MSRQDPDADRTTSGGGPMAPTRVDFRRVAAVLFALLLTVLFIWMVLPFLESLLLALVFSYFVYPVYERLRVPLRRDGIAAFVTTLGTLLVFAVPLMLIAGALSREAVRMTEELEPWIAAQIDDGGTFVTLPDWLPYRDDLMPYRSQILEKAGEALGQLGTLILDNLASVTQGTVAFVLYLFVMLYAMFFLLLRGPALRRVFEEHMPLSGADQRLILERGITVTRATLKSILVIGALQGTLGGIGFAVAGIEGPVFWGLLMAVASAIPGVGAALIWVPAAAILALGGQVATGIGLALWGALVVSGIDNVLRPYLIGHDTRMPDLLMLVSTLGGIAMFGATGLIIGPVLAGLFLTSLRIFGATFGPELARSHRGGAPQKAPSDTGPPEDEPPDSGPPTRSRAKREQHGEPAGVYDQHGRGVEAHAPDRTITPLGDAHREESRDDDADQRADRGERAHARQHRRAGREDIDTEEQSDVEHVRAEDVGNRERVEPPPHRGEYRAEFRQRRREREKSDAHERGAEARLPGKRRAGRRNDIAADEDRTGSEGRFRDQRG